jgi:hypothetical protein
MSKIDDILQRHAQRQPIEDRPESDGYDAYKVTPGFPQMAFSLVHRDGSEDVIEYHNASHFRFRPASYGGDEFLSFVYDRKIAVTITGKELRPLLHAIKEHTLISLYEKRPEDAVMNDGPVVSQIMMTDVSDAAGKMN